MDSYYNVFQGDTTLPNLEPWIIKALRVNVVATKIRVKKNGAPLSCAALDGASKRMMRMPTHLLIPHNWSIGRPTLHHDTFLYTLLFNSMHPIVLFLFLGHPSTKHFLQSRFLLLLA